MANFFLAGAVGLEPTTKRYEYINLQNPADVQRQYEQSDSNPQQATWGIQ